MAPQNLLAFHLYLCVDYCLCLAVKCLCPSPFLIFVFLSSYPLLQIYPESVSLFLPLSLSGDDASPFLVAHPEVVDSVLGTVCCVKLFTGAMWRE